MGLAAAPFVAPERGPKIEVVRLDVGGYPDRPRVSAAGLVCSSGMQWGVSEHFTGCSPHVICKPPFSVQAIEIDRLALEMTAAAGSGHPSSSMGIGHLVTVRPFQTTDAVEPGLPRLPDEIRLAVLSEGHAVPAVYAVLAKLGVMYGKDPSKRAS